MTVYFLYDPEKYFAGSIEADAQPENSTTVEPELQEGYWFKFDGTAWVPEKIPTAVEDIIGLSVHVAPDDPMQEDDTPQHEKLLRSIILRILADTDDAKTVIADGMLTVVAVTEEDKLNDAKAVKLQELSEKASAYQSYNCKEMYITSSLGFQVNADQCSQKNMEVLISLLPDDETTTTYKIYDNTFKELNRVQLATLRNECEQNGVNLYQQKFAYQAKIKACTTIEEIKAITIEFTMMDFSKSE